MSVASDAELIRFVYTEARLIDEKRFDEWYELFAEDARYWIPLTRGQQSGLSENSLMFEDKLLLKLRIERLRNPHAYSQAQPSWCQHVLEAPGIEDRGTATGVAVMRTPFLYVESRGDQAQVYAGVAWHHLKAVNERLAIAMKKVELVNCDAALPSLQLFP
ncbi:MAG: aromatic-ring-hydroxylating dioxygenase subunit beta [Steroidobacteraceae bacterium]|jgi:3-phenylpropionate/cinnamic acid dioxygenase small subunit